MNYIELSRRFRDGWLVALCVAICILPGLAAAQDEAKPAAEPAAAAADSKPAKPAKPEESAKPAEPAKSEDAAAATAEVEKGTVRVTLELEAMVEAATAHEILVRPEEWSAPGGLIVDKVAKHGARVKRGELLVAFDTVKIDKALEDLRADVELGRLSLQQAEQQLRALEELTPIDIEANERAARIAEEDRKYHFEKQRPFELRMADYQLTSAKNSLEYAQEELAQLEKMYEADDLTEETEAIVLKRARNSLESAQMQLQSAQLRHDLAVKFSFPREDDRVRETSQRSRVTTARAAVSLPLALEKQRLEVAKLSTQHGRSQEQLEDLEADREQLTIKSPADGIVYYGKSTRGKFGDVTSLSENLRPRGTVQLNQVLMTIVQPQPLEIRVTVPEDKLYRLRVGMAGVVVPKSNPQAKLPGVISTLSQVPLGTGNFEAVVKLTRSKASASLLPGMACTVKLEPYVKHDALYVPPKTVKSDDRNPDQQYVWLVGKNGEPVRRDVTVGETNDSQAEIVKGLAAGDKVLLEEPKKKKG